MRHQKTYIYGISACLFMMLTFFGATYMYISIYKAGNILTTSIAAIEENNSKEKMVKDLEVSLAKTKEERHAINAFILTEDQTSVFLTEIEKVAASQNVTLTTNSLEVVKPVKKVAVSTSTPAVLEPSVLLFDTLAISISIEGKEADVKKMLHIFETLPYHSNVNTFSLTREGGGNVKGALGLSISLLK